VIWYINQDSILSDYSWVGMSVGLHLKCKRGIVICGSGSVEGVDEASQFNGFGNGSNSHLNATSFNLPSVSIQTLPDMLSKNLNDEESCWQIHILKVWIDTCLKEAEPNVPNNASLCSASCHNPRLDVGVDSINSTCPMRAFGRWHNVQEALCEMGKCF